MNNNEIRVFMRDEIAKATPTSKIARIRAMFDDIENGLSSGLTLAWMAQKLNDGGIIISANTLSSFMSRIRKERKGTTATSYERNPNASKNDNNMPHEMKIHEEPKKVVSSDPRLLADIKNSAMDLRALAQIAKRKDN